ncbi:regulatory protein AfsR [Streptosporangium roseum]|uniref:Transcriptional regulator, SARP family n=2 Tax=Streptosporangium roseum TaxID=2001 RepID=D2AZV1_STRRD|nr:transcriptional regulator, SARP family [Streptosporangium roseum DSM 43021]
MPLGGMRQQRVMATLLLESNRIIPVSRLVQATWGEAAPATAHHQIRKMVADLRNRLGGGGQSIVTDGPGYRLVVEEDQLDLSLFDIRTRRAGEAEKSGLPVNAMTELQEALDLWTGQALSGIDGPVIRAAAELLDERRVAVTERLMDLRLTHGHARDLISDLRALVSEHPLRETLWTQLILALYRSNRHAEALRTYEDVRCLLADELGVDPGIELMKLHELILRNDPTLDCPSRRTKSGIGVPVMVRPCALPYDVPDFTGREAELQRLTSMVAENADRTALIVTIDGMAGIGKTAFAVHAAHKLARLFPDGQLFVDFNGFTPGRKPIPVAEAIATLLSTLGVPDGEIPHDLQGRIAMWRMRTAGRRLLLLLDNTADAAQVLPLLPGMPGCVTLITSRAPLSGVDGAVLQSLELLTPDESRALLERVVGTMRLATERETVTTLIEMCGRLPLALRIVAARLNNRPQWSVAHMVDRLGNERRRLSELVVGDRSVHAAIAHSYGSLRPDQQRLFRLLGLHPGHDYDAYAAAALAGIPVDEAESLLEGLLDSRLLVQREVGRYNYHNLVLSYARDAASSHETEHTGTRAIHRLLDYYLHTAEAAANLLDLGRRQVALCLSCPPSHVPPLADGKASLRWFDTERHNLRMAVEEAQRQGLHGHCYHLPHMMAHYLQLRGCSDDQLTLLKTAFDAAAQLNDHHAQGRTLLNLAVSDWFYGRFSEALDRAVQALAVAEKLGDADFQGACLSRIGIFHAALGRYEEALHHYKCALDIHEGHGNWSEVSMTLVSTSSTKATLGLFDDAHRDACRAVSIDRRSGYRNGEVMGLLAMSTAQAGMNDLEGAASSLNTAYELVHTDEMPGYEAAVLVQQGHLHRRLGQLDEATAAGRRAMEILGTTRRSVTAIRGQNLLGSIDCDRGDYILAFERHRYAQRLALRSGHRLETARALDGIARALAGLGQCEAARTVWREALDHFEEMGTHEVFAVRRRLARQVSSVPAPHP